MENPWKVIPFSDYEKHMSDPSVGQLQILNSIFYRQYSTYKPETLVYFGIGTGNGLEHVVAEHTKRVIGVDVNNEYLIECNARHCKGGFGLHLIDADINKNTIQLPPSDLFIANLFLEYVDLEKLVSLIVQYGKGDCILSTVVQKNNSEEFVSPTGIESLSALSNVHRTIIPEKLIETMKQNRFNLIFHNSYALPGKKELVRMDFQLQ